MTAAHKQFSHVSWINIFQRNGKQLMVGKRKGETALIFPERNTVGALKEENYDGMHEYPIG